MFRPRTRESVCNVRPFDPAKVYELEDLGLFLAQDDSIRIRGQEDEKYQYKIARATRTTTSIANELYNDSLWFALSRTLSAIISIRLETLGLIRSYVPMGTDHGRITPRTPIFCTEQSAGRRYTLFVFNDGGELGIWTGRLVSKTSILQGSLEHLVKLFESQDRTIVIGNVGQMHWHAGLKEALTYHQFICAGGRRIDHSTVIPGSETPEAHVATVLQTRQLGPGSTSLILTGASAYAIIAYLNSNWEDIENKLICLIGISACFSESDVSVPAFRTFLSTKCVNFCPSQLPINTRLNARTCIIPSVSGGHDHPEMLPVTCLESCRDFVKHAEHGERMHFCENAL